MKLFLATSKRHFISIWSFTKLYLPSNSPCETTKKCMPAVYIQIIFLASFFYFKITSFSHNYSIETIDLLAEFKRWENAGNRKLNIFFPV